MEIELIKEEELQKIKHTITKIVLFLSLGLLLVLLCIYLSVVISSRQTMNLFIIIDTIILVIYLFFAFFYFLEVIPSLKLYLSVSYEVRNKASLMTIEVCSLNGKETYYKNEYNVLLVREEGSKSNVRYYYNFESNYKFEQSKVYRVWVYKNIISKVEEKKDEND